MIVDKPICFITMGKYQLTQQLERGPGTLCHHSSRQKETSSIIQTETASALLNNQNFATFIKSSTTMSSAGIALMNQAEVYIPEDYFEAIAQFLDYACILGAVVGPTNKVYLEFKEARKLVLSREVEIAGLFQMEYGIYDVDILF